MKALVRTVLVGTLALAIGGSGLATGAKALTANSAPEWSVLEVSPNPADEGQLVTVHGVFTDADVDDAHDVTITWNGGLAQSFTALNPGAYEFWVTNVYKDDKPTGTPQDTFALTVSVTDGFNTVAQSLQMTVRNVAPTVSLQLSSSTILENTSVAASGTFTDPGTKDTFVAKLDWGDGSTPWTRSYLATDAKSFDAGTHVYAVHGSYAVTATVTDDDTGVGTASQTLVVQSLNHTPTDLALSATTPTEGDAATLSGTFADVDATDTHAVSVDFGDGSSTTLALDANAGSFSTTHVYTTAGSYTASVTVTDPANASVSGTVGVTVLVRNYPPSDVTLAIAPTVEGVAATLNGSFTDQNSADTHTVVVDWGDGASQSLSLGANVRAFAPLHAYLVAGTYTVRATVADNAGASANGSASETVMPVHHAPTNLVLTATGATEGGAATLSGSFSDADAADTHTVAVDWADGSATTLSLDAGVTSFTTSHVYTDAGTYFVLATATDPDGMSAAGTASIAVAPKTAAASLEDLAAMIKSWPLDAGTKNALLAKVNASCSSLSALANQVSALGGKKLTATQVSAITTELAKLSTALGCSGSATPNVRKALPSYGGVNRH